MDTIQNAVKSLRAICDLSWKLSQEDRAFLYPAVEWICDQIEQIESKDNKRWPIIEKSQSYKVNYASWAGLGEHALGVDYGQAVARNCVNLEITCGPTNNPQ